MNEQMNEWSVKNLLQYDDRCSLDDHLMMITIFLSLTNPLPSNANT